MSRNTETSSTEASQWVQERLTLFFGDFHPGGGGEPGTTIKQSFSPSSQISVNDEKLSINEFVQQLQSVAATTAKAHVTWGEISQSENDYQRIVTGSFSIARTMKFRIRVGPAQTNEDITFRAIVSSGPESKEHFVFDELAIQTESKSEPIHLQEIPQ